jgi:hypothetical protein
MFVKGESGETENASIVLKSDHRNQSPTNPFSFFTLPKQILQRPERIAKIQTSFQTAKASFIKMITRTDPVIY